MEKKFIDSLKIGRNGEITLNVTVLGYEEDGLHITFVPALDIYASGDSKDEALQALDETLRLYIDHVLEEGTLMKDLLNHGWKKHTYHKRKISPPKYDPRDIMSKIGVESFVVQDRQLALQP